MIALLLVQFVLLLTDRLAIAKMLNLQAIERRHDLDHLDGIPLHPQRHGHEDNLRDDCKQSNCNPPIAR